MQNRCQNYETCPSASGWCMNRQPSAECVQFLLTHITSKPKVLYVCDRRACKQGCNSNCDSSCNVTSDIRHAKNFELNEVGTFVERGSIHVNLPEITIKAPEDIGIEELQSHLAKYRPFLYL